MQPLLDHGDTVSEDLQGSMDLVREQLAAAIRLAASHLADLESFPNDLAVASATVSQRNSTMERLRAENARLGSEVSRLASEFEALHDELEVSRRRLGDRDAKTDRLRVVLMSARNSIYNGLAGPADQS